MKKYLERPPHPNAPTRSAAVLRPVATVFFLVLAAAIAAPAPESLVGTWTGKGEGMFKAKYEVKLALADDKTCVLEYSDREPPHSLNPELSSDKITVTGTWKLENHEAEDHIVIEGRISRWIQTILPTGERPQTTEIKPGPIDNGLYFTIQPDGTLKRALVTFKGEGLLPGLPLRKQAIGVNLTKQTGTPPCD